MSPTSAAEPAAVAPEAREARRRPGFLVAYALAFAGGTIGYVPLLSMLLPLKVAAVAGAERIGVLATCAVAGAVAASIANIVFGALSDASVGRRFGRRGWIALGVALTAASFALVWRAATPGEIVLAIVLFQLALNAALAPLVAIMAEEVPDRQKGLVGGMLAFANPAGFVMTALVVALPVGNGDGRQLAAVAIGFAALIAPLLLTRSRLVATPPAAAERAMRRGDLALAWAARLAAQIAGAVLFLYLLFYFESIAGAAPRAQLAQQVSNVAAVAFALPVPLALFVGRRSDRTGRRKPFLLAASGAMALGLATMALTRDWAVAVAALCVFACGLQVFLGLHAAFAMQILPNPKRRGRDLGILNLTNTLPSLIGPALAWTLATTSDFSALFLGLAALAVIAGLLMLPVASER